MKTANHRADKYSSSALGVNQHIVMSVLSVLLFIAKGRSLRRSYSKKPPDDAALLELFSRILAGQETCLERLSAALEQGTDFVWEDVYDFVNPFGDRRGDSFNSVWTFDLDKDTLFLNKKDQLFSVPLRIARQRPLVLDDFTQLDSLTQTLPEEETLPGPYWEPELDILPRQRSFLGRVLRDFAHTWRHVLRRQMNTTTFMKLSYATLWIATMDFTIRERIGFEHITEGGPYVRLVDLPNWETPEATLVKAGSSWFALAQDTQEGLEMVQRHAESRSQLKESTTSVVTYAILTLRQVTLCKAHESQVVWTRPEVLFGDNLASDTAINMILWATNTTMLEPQPSKLSRLPPEIQDKILYHATTSLVASAKLGCELGLGSPFSWVERGAKIRVQETKRHRFESSPVESQILFNGVMGGLSYRQEPGRQAILPRGPFPPGFRHSLLG